MLKRMIAVAATFALTATAALAAAESYTIGIGQMCIRDSFCVTASSNKYKWCRNLYLLSIAYDLSPRPVSYTNLTLLPLLVCHVRCHPFLVRVDQRHQLDRLRLADEMSATENRHAGL